MGDVSDDYTGTYAVAIADTQLPDDFAALLAATVACLALSSLSPGGVCARTAVQIIDPLTNSPANIPEPIEVLM
jgi:hypothetical protein